MAEQTYHNHRRFVPGYHFVTFGILTVNFFWSLYRLFWGYPAETAQMPLFDRVLAVLVAGALLILAFYARVFALRVQDRVIRNEMQARLAAALPPDLRPRIGEIRTAHLIALRFAGDEELPELTRQALEGRFKSPDEIKRAVRSWRADVLRA
jgi:hypothetical protein